MKPALLASAGIAAFAVTSWSADELVVDGDLMVNGDAMVEQSLQTAGADGVLFTGEFGTGQLLTTGAGTRFMWYPLKGAVRGGLVTDTHWDDNTGWNPIGDYSFAWGRDSQARGKYSFSFGDWSRAEQDHSVAVGFGAVASAQGAIAIGQSPTASGVGAVALGDSNHAAATGAVALGDGTTANIYGLTSGYSSVAGPGAAALGIRAEAPQLGSASIGYFTVANGQWSAAFGRDTIAQARGQFVIGQNNIAQGSGNEWIETDDLFIVGNGEIDGVRSNAFTIKKSGDTTIYGAAEISGDLRVENGWTTLKRIPAQGDIDMGQFTAELP